MSASAEIKKSLPKMQYVRFGNTGLRVRTSLNEISLSLIMISLFRYRVLPWDVCLMVLPIGNPGSKEKKSPLN
jgi:hypothetical protein